MSKVKTYQVNLEMQVTVYATYNLSCKSEDDAELKAQELFEDEFDIEELNSAIDQGFDIEQPISINITVEPE
ncbi:MAG: hypothetical protein NVS2B14_00220 [Chamaesiphon sp.]